MHRAATILALLLGVASLYACDATSRLRDSPRTDPSWVDVYDPRAASPGYNLTLYRWRRPLLIDLNGNIVHSWNVVATDRVRLLRDGRLLAIGTDGAVREYDWDGELVWEFRTPAEDFPHHDLIRLENGNRLVLLHDHITSLDYLLEVDGAGRIVWEWHAAEHLAADIARAHDGTTDIAQPKNATHLNSIHELPPNRWFEQGDTRFRPGNILISARELNTIYVIDKSTKEVVWRFDHRLDRQHEATMAPPGFPGEGNILVFNNGLEDRYVYRSSAVIEIDPVTGTEVWSYRAPHFFSSTRGTQQLLPNGNIMVTASRGGRVFEVTRDGGIVWQWTPPYLPTRDLRYPYDHCPQLEKLRRPAPTGVERSSRHHVDLALYDFALDHQSVRTKIDGRDRRLLKEPNACRVVLLPERPQMTVKFGFTSEAGAAIETSGAAAGTAAPVVVKAAVRLRPAVPTQNGSAAAASVLFERELRFTPRRRPSSHFDEATVDVHEYALAPIELCFSAESSDGGPPDPRFVWLNPAIRSAARNTDEPEVPAANPGQEAEREKRLRALGYVD